MPESRSSRTLPLLGAALLTTLAILLLQARAQRDACDDGVMCEAGDVASRLTTTPASAHAGATLQLRYQPLDADFAAESVLVVRGVFHGSSLLVDPVLRRAASLATLHRGEGGFHGTLLWPDSAVWAELTIETRDGQHVDANDGRFFSVLLGEAGVPSADALAQRLFVRGAGDAAVARTIAADLKRHHPDRPVLALLARSLADHPASERNREALRRDLARIEGSLRRQTVHAADMIAAAGLASMLQEPDAEEFWYERFAREHPWQPMAIELRTRNLAPHLKTRARDVQDSAEAMWASGHGAVESLAWLGWQAARALADTAAMSRWFERAVAVTDEGETFRLSRQLAREPATRARSVSRLRAELARIETQDPVSIRPLGRTASQQRRRQANLAARVRNELGRVLLLDGQAAEAAHLLAASTDAPNPLVYSTLANAQLASGDTVAALASLAEAAAADIQRRTFYADTARERTGRFFDAVAFTQAVTAAEPAVFGRLLDDGDPPRALPADAQLRTPDGGTVALQDLWADGPVVIHAWSGDAGEVRVMAARSAADFAVRYGTRWVVVTTDRRRDDVRARLARSRYDVPVYHDETGAVLRALRVTSPSTYHVIDAAGRMRASAAAADIAVLWGAALSAEPAPKRIARP